MADGQNFRNPNWDSPRWGSPQYRGSGRSPRGYSPRGFSSRGYHGHRNSSPHQYNYNSSPKQWHHSPSTSPQNRFRGSFYSPMSSSFERSFSSPEGNKNHGRDNIENWVSPQMWADPWEELATSKANQSQSLSAKAATADVSLINAAPCTELNTSGTTDSVSLLTSDETKPLTETTEEMQEDLNLNDVSNATNEDEIALDENDET